MLIQLKLRKGKKKDKIENDIVDMTDNGDLKKISKKVKFIFNLFRDIYQNGGGVLLSNRIDFCGFTVLQDGIKIIYMEEYPSLLIIDDNLHDGNLHKLKSEYRKELLTVFEALLEAIFNVEIQS